MSLDNVNAATMEERIMKSQSMFEEVGRRSGETAVFGTLGVAGVVMILVAISSMVNFAVGLDRAGTTVAADTIMPASNVTVASHGFIEPQLTDPRPTATGSKVPRRAESHVPASCSAGLCVSGLIGVGR